LAVAVRGQSIAPVAEPQTKAENSPSDEPTHMDAVIVSGYRENYAAGDNYSASRIYAPLMTLPLSTGQITNKLLVDQNVVDVNDALKNVSGVAPAFGGPHPLIVNIRGFVASVYKDGFKIGGNNNLSAGADDLPISSISVDRIEILKGPSTILYGRGEPGGIVNFISKQPQAKPEYAIETLVGSFQQYRIGASATGPLVSQGSVLYRVDASYENSQSYRDSVETKTYFAKPSLLVKVSDRTKIYLTGELAHSEFTPDRGVLMLPSMSSTGVLTASFAPISSRSYFFGDPTDHTDKTQRRAVAQVEHIVSPDWTIRASASLEQVKEKSSFEADWFYTFGGYMPLGAPAGTFPANWSVRLSEDPASQRTDSCLRLENYFRLRHRAMGADVDHGILVDLDALRIHTDISTNYRPNEILDPRTGARAGIFVPGLFHDENNSISKDYGASVQDLITINNRWHLLLGGRIEKNLVDVTQLAVGAPAPSSTSNKYSGFVPRLGALYQVADNLSLYASYMGSYQSPGADYGLYDISTGLKPERAYQTEAGVKIEFLRKRLLVTSSVFSIKKHDVIASETDTSRGLPYTILYYNIGKEDAQGADIDVVGELSRNLRIVTSFNRQSMVFTNPKKLIVDGKHRYGTPTYSGNIWAVYEFTDGWLKGLGLGGGAATRSSVFANDANEAQVPSFTTFDAVAYYKISQFRVQANLYNLTDKLGYNVSGIGGTANPTNPFVVMPIAPFRLSVGATWQF